MSDGRQSMEEIVRAANERGLKEIAITDHGPMAAVIGVKIAQFIWNKSAGGQAAGAVSRYAHTRRGGSQYTDLDGTLDIPEEVITELDLLIAGLHPLYYPYLGTGRHGLVGAELCATGQKAVTQSLVANTEALIAAVENNPSLDIISHLGSFFAVDESHEACSRHEVLFEINCGHNHPDI